MKRKVALACSQCGSRNYSTDKNTESVSSRLELRKYCKNCSTHTIHRETK